MATSSVQNEESTKVGVPSKACKRTEPLDTFQMLSNNLILIEKLREGYHHHIIQYDVNLAALKILGDIILNFKERLGDYDYVNKLECFERRFERFRHAGDAYLYFQYSNKKQSELFFELKEDNKNFQHFLEELSSLHTKTLSNTANDEKNKNFISTVKQCLKDVSDLKNICPNIQYDHSTSVFVVLEECLDFDDDLLAFWKNIDKDFTEENTKKALLQLQMSVKKKKEQLLKGNQNVDEKIREDERKKLSKMEYFLECISKNFTGHSYALVDHEAVSSMCERWDCNTKDFYPDILNFDVFKRSVSKLKNSLDLYSVHLQYYPYWRKVNNVGSRTRNWQVHHWMREVATHLEEYQMDLNKKLSSQQRSKDQTYNKSIEKIQNTLEKLKPLPGFLDEIKRIFDKPTLLCIDLDKNLQFDEELLNYWNKLKESSDDNGENLMSLYSEIKKRKENVLKERRIAEKFSNLELSGKNDSFQGKALEGVD